MLFLYPVKSMCMGSFGGSNIMEGDISLAAERDSGYFVCEISARYET